MIKYRMQYSKEQTMVREVSQKLFALVNRGLKDHLETTSKTAAYDVVSHMDLAADRLLVRTIKKYFPNDTRITEESSPTTALGEGRTWVIDPICGSKNASRGIRLFVTNIALVVDRRVVAAWVIDYNRGRILWCVGGLVYDGKRPVRSLQGQTLYPIVDANQGYRHLLSASVWASYNGVLLDLYKDRSLAVISFWSSISFAFIATGQLQGAVTVDINAWDFAAGAFLIEKNGGIITNFDGSPWSLNSRSLVLSANRGLHRRLLRVIAKHRLQSLV